MNERRSLGKSRKARAGEIAEPATPLRNYTTFARKKKSYFREFQPEKQLSFFFPSLPPLLLLFHPSATGRIIFPRDFGPRTITRPLLKIHRERVSCVSETGRGAGNSRKSRRFPPGRDVTARFEFRSKSDARCFTGFSRVFPKLETPLLPSPWKIQLSFSLGELSPRSRSNVTLRFDRPSTKQHCSNINTGNREEEILRPCRVS